MFATCRGAQAVCLCQEVEDQTQGDIKGIHMCALKNHLENSSDNSLLNSLPLQARRPQREMFRFVRVNVSSAASGYLSSPWQEGKLLIFRHNLRLISRTPPNLPRD